MNKFDCIPEGCILQMFHYKDECDFPENVNCEISLGDIAQMKV